MRLTDENVNHLKEWFTYIVKGLYRYEARKNLNPNHEIYLMYLNQERDRNFWIGWVSNSLGSQLVERSQGEFTYTFALSDNEVSSAWIVKIHGAYVFAITAKIDNPALLKQLEALRW